jgi:hypothetical protein
MGITTIKLSQLRLSPLNQRRVKPSAVEAMADDIAAHGLLQNLVAYEDEGLFYVFAGGRRYRGLKELAKRKRIKNNDTFPVEVRTKEEAIELSLAENFQREDMLGHVSRVSFDRKDKRVVCLFQAARSAYPKSWRRAAWNKHLRGGCGIVPLAIGGDESVTRTPLGLSARLSAPHI